MTMLTTRNRKVRIHHPISPAVPASFAGRLGRRALFSVTKSDSKYMLSEVRSDAGGDCFNPLKSNPDALQGHSVTSSHPTRKSQNQVKTLNLEPAKEKTPMERYCRNCQLLLSFVTHPDALTLKGFCSTVCHRLYREQMNYELLRMAGNN